ncbi:hypothetical protein ACFVMC_11640 [Nocardia sp. NPDC127579]
MAQMLHEWHATALIYADPVLSRKLSEPIEGDFGPVPPPMGE